MSKQVNRKVATKTVGVSKKEAQNVIVKSSIFGLIDKIVINKIDITINLFLKKQTLKTLTGKIKFKMLNKYNNKIIGLNNREYFNILNELFKIRIGLAFNVAIDKKIK